MVVEHIEEFVALMDVEDPEEAVGSDESACGPDESMDGDSENDGGESGVGEHGDVVVEDIVIVANVVDVSRRMRSMSSTWSSQSSK